MTQDSAVKGQSYQSKFRRAFQVAADAGKGIATAGISLSTGAIVGTAVAGSLGVAFGVVATIGVTVGLAVTIPAAASKIRSLILHRKSA